MNTLATVVPYAQMSTLFMEHQAEHKETILHTLRCTKAIGEFGSYLGMSKDKVHTLEQGAMIHDAGKFFLSADVLYSPRSLTKNEFELIKAHPLMGDFDIQDIDIKSMKEQHHEYLDGTGYPYGLKGNAIHPYAQILTIVDVHDALSHARSYKKAWSKEEVRVEMYKHSGTRFDSELLDAFFEHLESKELSN